MPLPKPHKGEERDAFISRCMSDDIMKSEYPKEDQRAAVCIKQWETKDSKDEGSSVLLVDRASYGITKREFQDNGYLKVPGRVARSGIQKYLASELGLQDRSPNDVINVYRPPEEVFDEESLKSYDNVDVTNDHPEDLVDSESYKRVSVGHAISVGHKDGDFVEVDLLIKDKGSIKEIQDGKVELSAGYRARYLPEKGTSPDGQQYEFVQRDIRINHIALVDKARAGREAKLYDQNQPEYDVMKATVTLDSGNVVEVEDKSTATLIQTTIDGLRKKVKDAEEETAKANEKLEEEKAKKEKTDEELEKEKEKSSDAAVAAKVKEVKDTMEQARNIVGEEFTCDSVNVTDIRKAALKKVRDKVDWDNQSEHYVKAAWDMEVEKSGEQRQKDRAHDTHRSLGEDLEKRYTAKDGTPVGTSEYVKFLHGQPAGGSE